MASSSDGIQWTKYNDPATTEAPYVESDPVFQPGETGSWDAYQVHQPRVLETPQGWVMFYRGTKDKNGNTMALGLATSDDGIHWDRSTLNPIFVPNDISGAAYFWFHNAVFVNDIYFLFIEGDISQPHKFIWQRMRERFQNKIMRGCVAPDGQTNLIKQ